jgi:hypothetical protein
MTIQPAAGEPCPCGSARAFSACCADAFAREVPAWQQRQDAERRLVKAITEHAFRTWGWHLFTYALRMFSTKGNTPEVLLVAMPVFDRWFALTWLPNPEDEQIDVPASWPSATLGLSWLASGSAACSDLDQHFIVRAAESPYSAFVVETVCRGWCLTVRDLMTDRRFRVVDPEVSASVRPDDILFSAIVTIGGISTLLGPAPYTLPAESRLDLFELRHDYVEGPWMTCAELVEMDITGALCDEYLEACARGAASLLDAADEAREPLHLQWTVATPFEDLLERLRPLSMGDGEEAITIDNGPDGEPHAVITWYQPGPAGHEDDYRMIGILSLDQGRLSADVPTGTLARRLTGEVSALLGATATLVDTWSGSPVRVHTRGCWLPLPLP